MPRAPTGLKQEASCGLTIPLVSALDDFQILDGGRSPQGEEKGRLALQRAALYVQLCNL